MDIKKLLTIIVIAFPFFISSCTKDSNSSDEGDGAWTVYRTGGLEYNLTVETAARQEIDGFKVLTATSTEDTSAPKTINFWFKEWPLSSGTYRPVEFLKNRQLEAEQIGITLTFPGKDTLYSTGLKFVGVSPDPAEDVKITSTNGKLTINIPTMSAWTAGIGIDSAYFKGVINE